MIKLKITNYINKFKLKCINNYIDFTILKETDNTLIIKTQEKYLDKIKELNYYSDIEILCYTGLKNIINKIKLYKYDLLLLILSVISLYIISNIIIKIEIKHENKEIKEQIKNILKDHNIKIFTISKNLNTLNNISDSIIKENNDFIEWISINRDGMKYIVSIEDRIKITNQKEEQYCNIIADKTGVITKINAKSGDILVETNKLVHKGDLLISGDIILNEEIKDKICADGYIYAENWYKVHITLPLNYQIKEYTKNYRYNFYYRGKPLYKKNYKYYDESIILNKYNFKIVKEQEYKILNKKYTLEEAHQIALSKAENKLLEKIGNNSKIISRKVLKETQKNSKIELDIFISIEQLISKRITYEAGDTSDTR